MNDLVELGRLVDDLRRDQAQWSQATFGSDITRGPAGPLAHMEKELTEARKAWADCSIDEYIEELADVYILWMDSVRRSGLCIEDVFKAAVEKMVKNKARRWPKMMDPNAPVEHIRDADDAPVAPRD